MADLTIGFLDRGSGLEFEQFINEEITAAIEKADVAQNNDNDISLSDITNSSLYDADSESEQNTPESDDDGSNGGHRGGDRATGSNGEHPGGDRGIWPNVNFMPIVHEAFCGPLPYATILLNENKTELNFFLLFFDEDLINLLVEETNKYV